MIRYINMNTKTGQPIQRIKNYVYLTDDLIGKGAAGKVYKGIFTITEDWTSKMEKQ